MEENKRKTCPLCGKKWPAEDFHRVKITSETQRFEGTICGKCTKQVVAEVFCGKKSSHSENESGKAGE